MSHEIYENPLVTRYASREMAGIFSSQNRHSWWRKLWIALAEAEQELGLNITDEQLAQLRANVDNIDFARVAEIEKERRHDVMSHVEAYKEVAPAAGPIIHLGATSCFVTDNGDMVLYREGLELVKGRLTAAIRALANLAKTHRDLPCLAYTHLQPAQPTTMGKRFCLWLYDLVLDMEELEYRLSTLAARSTKGTTGTQASFLQLFDGDHAKVRELERRVATKMGFEKIYAVTGQTYPRKVDTQILNTLAGIAESTHKLATDLRLLSSWREIDEPFEDKQIGSSAMPYKRNPMRSERICSLARYAMALPATAAQTTATQWMERTLDDSALRRITLPQAMLAIDAILILITNIASGLRVYPKVVLDRLKNELPFMATESIMMAGVAAGGDRQVLHEVIREHSIDAGTKIKAEGGENDLLDRLRRDDAFAKVNFEQVLAALAPEKFVGRAPEQVDDFLAEVVQPMLDRLGDLGPAEGEIRV